MSSKATIRIQMRTWRAAQDPDHLRAWSERVCLHLRSDERFTRARTIHSFWPMIERGEVDLRPLLRSLQDEGRTVWLPVVHDQTLLHTRFAAGTTFQRASFGQEEPEGQREQSVNADVVLVPALAVDTRGHRVGYGGGFYDRFLQDQDALRIAIVYSAQILPSVPFEDHDQPLDAIVSEAGWHDVRV